MNYSVKKLQKFHVRQLGEYACGLACLSSISKYYGGEISQEKLRDVSGTTISGTTLLGLIQAAKEIGLEAKGFEADMEHLKQQNSPVILHVVLDEVREHFVVVFGFAKGGFWVSDPGVGIECWTEERLLKVWRSKILLQVNRTNQFETKKSTNHSKKEWFKSLILEDIPVLLVATVLGTLMAITGLSTAIFSQKLIDDFLPNETYQKAVFGVLALGVLLIFRALLGYFQGIFMARQGRGLTIRIVTSFMDKILRLPMKYFKGYSTGDFIARMNDSIRIKNTVSMITGSVIINFLVVAVSLSFVFYQSWLIGILSLGGIAAFGLTGWYYHSPILKKQKEVMVAHASNETQFIDGLTGVPVIRSYGKEQEYGDRMNQMFVSYQDKGYDLAILGNSFSFFTQLIVAVFTGLLFGVGVYLVFDKSLLLGELMSLIQVGSSIIPAVAGLVVANIQLQEAKVAFDRMHEISGLPSEQMVIGDGNAGKTDLRCLLDLKEVKFRYPGRMPILNGISFQLNPRESLGLFAPVGTGKSTLVDLIQQFYSPESGEINLPFLQGQDLGLEDWRSQMAVISQKEKIFNTNVLDNIVLTTNQEEVQEKIQFLQSLDCLQLLQNLPQGILTLCGEEGRNLSGGQRQLLGILRALAKKPKILIMDEATSAMDFEMEGKILSLIQNYIKEFDSGLLLITHQPILAMRLDRLLILEMGRITAQGEPIRLLESDNLFSKAYQYLLKPNSKDYGRTQIL